MRCVPTVANPGQQQFFGVITTGPATALAEVEDRQVLAGPTSPVGQWHPAEVPAVARQWDSLPVVQASAEVQIHTPRTPACSPRMFHQNVVMDCKVQDLPMSNNMGAWPPCPVMPQFLPHAEEAVMIFPNDDDVSPASPLSPRSCGSSVIGEDDDDSESTASRQLLRAATEVVESCMSPRPFQAQKSTRSLPDAREGGEDWVARYTEHSGHLPVSAVQLQAFALNRGEQLPYSTALRMITDRHQMGQDSTGSEIQEAGMTMVAATSSSCTEAPSCSAGAGPEFSAGHCDEDSAYMINTPTESEVGALQLPMDGEHCNHQPGPCDTSANKAGENNYSGPSPRQPRSPVQSQTPAQSRTPVHAQSSVHVQPPVLRLAEALSHQRQGDGKMVAPGSPISPMVARAAEAGSRGAAPPALGSAGLPSRGSALHRWGSCKPCAFFHQEGCRNGTNCEFCHLCDAGARKRRKYERLASMRAAREGARRQQQQLQGVAAVQQRGHGHC